MATDTDTTDPDEILQAREAFSVPGPTDVAAGDLFHRSDPIVAGREHLFRPVASTVRASVPGAPVSPPPFLVPDRGSGAEPGQGGAEGDTAAPTGKRGRKASEGD